jgi:glutathione-independent formaldehyde dehydrogenase
VLKYNRQLMQAIFHDRLPIADIVNAKVIPLHEAVQGYESFDQVGPPLFGAILPLSNSPSGTLGGPACAPQFALSRR